MLLTVTHTNGEKQKKHTTMSVKNQLALASLTICFKPNISKMFSPLRNWIQCHVLFFTHILTSIHTMNRWNTHIYDSHISLLLNKGTVTWVPNTYRQINSLCNYTSPHTHNKHDKIYIYLSHNTYLLNKTHL